MSLGLSDSTAQTLPAMPAILSLSFQKSTSQFFLNWKPSGPETPLGAQEIVVYLIY